MAGNPKIPLPITEFTASAARLQRPMARTRPVCGDVIANRLYHNLSFLELNFLLDGRYGYAQRNPKTSKERTLQWQRPSQIYGFC